MQIRFVVVSLMLLYAAAELCGQETSTPLRKNSSRSPISAEIFDMDAIRGPKKLDVIEDWHPVDCPCWRQSCPN